MQPLFATNILKNVHVCFLANKCATCENSDMEASEVEYCIASGFVRIVRQGDGRTWITHISNVSISYDSNQA
jgi:hypothetical protein